MQAVAGIDIYSDTLRYAEVQGSGNGPYQLLRLGSCDFEFDIAHEMLHQDEPDYADVMTDALEDVFAGTEADTLRVAFHPTDVYTFFTPVSAEASDADRQHRLEDEAALLADAPSTDALHLTSEPVRTDSLADGRQVEWTHVLAMPRLVQDHFAEVMDHLPHTSYEWALTSRGAARVAEWTDRQTQDASAAPYTLVIGRYPDHAEYVVLKDGTWYFSYHAVTRSSSDCAYYAVALLDRLDIPFDAVEHVQTYGLKVEAADLDPLTSILETAPESLDPLAIVGLGANDVPAGVHPESYVPCIGVTL